MLNLVFQTGKSEMERKGNFGPSYLSFPVPFRPFQINPPFLSLSEKNGQLSGKGNIAFLSLTCMALGAFKAGYKVWDTRFRSIKDAWYARPLPLAARTRAERAFGEFKLSLTN